MNLPSAAAIFWHVRTLVDSLGRTGLLLIGGLAATLIVYLNVLHPLESTVAGARDDTETLRSRLAERHTTLMADDPSRQLAEFYSHFPVRSSALDAVESLFEAAAATNIALDRTEYRLSQNPSGGLTRYDLVIPVKARYGQIRRFLADVLAKNQNLALDGVSFSRTAASDVGVEAQLHLTLYLRDSE